MNYSALIENRKSVRAFTDKKVPFAALAELETYFNHSVKRLVPEIKTELMFFDDSSKEALEGAAGYNNFLVGAPQYLVLLSEKAELAHLNAGFIMEDLILKLTDMDLNTCWLTFTDSEGVKSAIGIETDQEVVALAAFGYGVKTTKRLRLNIRSMSNIDISAKRHYTEPKRSIYDMVFLNTWGNTHKLDDYIGFFDNMLWDAYTTKIDGELSLGIVLHHLTAVASEWAGNLQWKFGKDSAQLQLPEGHEVVASSIL